MRQEHAGAASTLDVTPGDEAAPNQGREGTMVAYYDGACPLCRREVAFLQPRCEPERVQWVDVAAQMSGDAAPDLGRNEALGRFHVRLPDGALVSGPAAFAALWEHARGLGWLARIAGKPALEPLLELFYRAFLVMRPALQRLFGGRDVDRQDDAAWLARELRSDHAGESGAVAIYRGMLAASLDTRLRAFAARHLATERRHLEAVSALVPTRDRSRLLLLWKGAGYLTGALAALGGPNAAYHTVDAVETFVDHHYRCQIERLSGIPDHARVRDVLASCHHDELTHRDEARSLAGRPPGAVLWLWLRAVALGSTFGVAISRRV